MRKWLWGNDLQALCTARETNNYTTCGVILGSFILLIHCGLLTTTTISTSQVPDHHVGKGRVSPTMNDTCDISVECITCSDAEGGEEEARSICALIRRVAHEIDCRACRRRSAPRTSLGVLAKLYGGA